MTLLDLAIPAMPTERQKTNGGDNSVDKEGLPPSWGGRITSGGKFQIRAILPHPYVSDADADGVVAEPDWSRLELWEELFSALTDSPLDDLDRKSQRLPARSLAGDERRLLAIFPPSPMIAFASDQEA